MLHVQFIYLPDNRKHKFLCNQKTVSGYAVLPGCPHVRCQCNEAWGSACAGSPEHRLLELVGDAGSFHTQACPGSQLFSTEPLSAEKNI